MDKILPPDVSKTAPRDLREQLDASRDDLEAGNVRPLEAVLFEIHSRASARMERQRQMGRNTAKKVR